MSLYIPTEHPPHFYLTIPNEDTVVISDLAKSGYIG